MTAPFAWIRPEPHGIHVVPADCWIDPSRPVANALITHGHADHARGGHGRTVATPATLAIMELRYQTREGAMPVEYGETIRLPGEVDVTYVPAGHVLGSAQIVLEHAGERVVVTGDYKRSPDPTCPPFEVVPCDVFVTEATFGLPVFCHPPIEHEDRQAAQGARRPSRALRAGRRLCAGQGTAGDRRVAPGGHHEPVWLHGAMERMCRLYEDFGVDLGDLRLVSDARRSSFVARSWCARLRRSTTAGAGACPIRSRRWPAGGCACASARGSGWSSCRW
jgi:putative mRNA 3-end processing factor